MPFLSFLLFLPGVTDTERKSKTTTTDSRNFHNPSPIFPHKMSHFDGSTKKSTREAGLDALSDRFNSALSSHKNRPDFKELDLGSPVSPLRTHLAKATSSSSSSSGSISGNTRKNSVPKKSENHSGELSGSSEGSPTAADSGRHNRPYTSLLPSGNICPSGKIGKPMACRNSSRSDVLGSGTVNYGHGSIVRGKSAGEPSADLAGNVGSSAMVKKGLLCTEPEEVKRIGNELYKRGNFSEALLLYDRAIAISPDNAACRSNRAAALIGLGRLSEAVKECEEALRLDPAFGRAHQRLASLHLRLGQVEKARSHFISTPFPDSSELQKLQIVEQHLSRCADARKIGDWKCVLREGDAAIAAGADSSPQLFASRVQALLKLHHLVEADSALSNIPKFEPSPSSCSQTKLFGMLCEAYAFLVRAQVEMALGRFENAIAAAEKARQIDPRNVEVAAILNNVRSVVKARACGNDLFNSGKLIEACAAYGEGLKFDPCNPVLYCNRAACRYKLGQWERSVEDCNEALKIHPNYTKALLRRAASNDKLERWADCVRDYEVLRMELPGDKEVAEALFHAQIALKKSRGEEVYNVKFGGEVEEISGVDLFRAAISSPGVSVVHFMLPSNLQCNQISPFVDTLCHKYPSVNFFKVNTETDPSLANAESVRIVPTFKIYKNGTRMKEMICPSQQVLEYSVRHYSL